MGSHEDAEDAVQEAFLRAFSAFENLRNDDGKPWLLAIVRNTCLTSMRRHRTMPAAAGLDQAVNDLTESSPDPEKLLLISVNREEVRRALEQLPAEFREAIVLRELEELSYKEIAATVGVPVGTVMSRLSRGREWLRRMLSGPKEEVQQRRTSG